MKGACYVWECLNVCTLKCFDYLWYLWLSVVRVTSTFWLPMQAEMAIFETKLSELLQNQIRRNCGKTANHKVGNVCVAYIVQFQFSCKKVLTSFGLAKTTGNFLFPAQIILNLSVAAYCPWIYVHLLTGRWFFRAKLGIINIQITNATIIITYSIIKRWSGVDRVPIWKSQMGAILTAIFSAKNGPKVKNLNLQKMVLDVRRINFSGS